MSVSIKQLEDMALDLHGKAERGEVKYGTEQTRYLFELICAIQDRAGTVLACRRCGVWLRGQALPHVCPTLNLDEPGMVAKRAIDILLAAVDGLGAEHAKAEPGALAWLEPSEQELRRVVGARLAYRDALAKDLG